MENGQESIDTFAELWNQLTPLQRRFAVSMQEHPTKKEAAEAIEISPNTVYNWPSIVHTVVDFMSNNIALATLGILQANATKAAMVKAHGLDSDNERRSAACWRILFRSLISGRCSRRPNKVST